MEEFVYTNVYPLISLKYIYVKNIKFMFQQNRIDYLSRVIYFGSLLIVRWEYYSGVEDE
jgi:hypothetical protein